MYWRRVRERERVSSTAPLEYRSELDYDRIDIMEKIDSLPLGWRMLINEHGFTPVIKAREYARDINVVEKLMNQRHRMRQQQLAEGHF
jgi:hypothetical protein